MTLLAITTRVKKQILISVFAGVFVCFSMISHAADTENSHEVTPSSQALKGSFSQTKSIKPLKRPFKSHGKFVYIPTQGLLWHTQTPVDSLKLFAKEGVYTIDEMGVLNKEAQLDNDFFLALFSGNQQKLTRFFYTNKIAQATENSHECIELTPKNNTLKSLFKKINVCSTEVDLDTKLPTTIHLIDPKDNITQIKLELSSDIITTEELAYFD
jgi:hypothetical protein